MLTVRQIDLSYESIWSIRSHIHRLNVTFCCRSTECSQPGVVILEGKETRCNCLPKVAGGSIEI